MDEGALLERARAGDPDAFASLVEAHREAIYRAAYHVVRDEEEALDVLQEALLAAYRNLSGFRGEASFRTWARRIAVNRALNRLRRRKARPAGALPNTELLVDSRSEAPIRGLERAELQAAVRVAIDSLPPDQALALRLHDIEGMTYAEVAAATEVPPGTVMSRIHYARRKLRDKLSGLMPSRQEGGAGG